MQQLLLMCPLDSELLPLVEAFIELGFPVEEERELSLPLFRIPSKGIVIAVGGHGKVQFGIHAQYLATHLDNLSGLICVGAGGGLATHLNIGDLVIAEQTIEHDYREKFDPNATLPEFIANPHLLARFKNRSLNIPFGVHYGIVASGDEDIVDAIRAEELHASTKALAVAWEGAGGAKACKFNKLPYLEIRAITDNARDSAPNSFAKNLGRCMKNAAILIAQAI